MKSFPRPRVFWSREDKPPTLHEEVFEHWLDLVGKCQIPLSARNSKGLQSRQDGVCSPNGRQYSIRGVDPGPFADRDLHPLLLKQSPPGGSHSESSGTANRRFLSLEFRALFSTLVEPRHHIFCHRTIRGREQMTVGNRTNPFVSAPCCFRHHRCARLFRVTKGEHCPKTTAYFAGCFEVADL